MPCAEGAPLSVVVAAGPFTAADSLAFEPLEELLAFAAAGRAPDTLLLMGPFVDSEQALVADGSLAVTFEQLFLVQAKLPKIPHTQIPDTLNLVDRYQRIEAALVLDSLICNCEYIVLIWHNLTLPLACCWLLTADRRL